MMLVIGLVAGGLAVAGWLASLGHAYNIGRAAAYKSMLQQCELLGVAIGPPAATVPAKDEVN